MIILGPEQLSSSEFNSLLSIPEFAVRVFGLSVDEIHLLHIWGNHFRQSFQRITFMRARFRKGIVMIGLTATFPAERRISDSILRYLGMVRGQFHLIRRSCARYDIQILFRHLQSGINGFSFSELDWILKSGKQTIIFASSINLVFRIKCYFNSLTSQDRYRDHRTRTYHSLNWPDFNKRTLELFADGRCQIIIATNALAQGNDIKAVEMVVQVGEPESVEMAVQKMGRARPQAGKDLLALFYISDSRIQHAKEVLEGKHQNTEALNENQSSASAMDRRVAGLITAQCKVAEIDSLFSNPTTDEPCLCRTCSKTLLILKPATCNCSGCIKEPVSIRIQMYQPPSTPMTKSKGIRLTMAEREKATKHLEEFRLRVWRDKEDELWLPCEQFLPSSIIKDLVDKIASITSLDNVAVVVENLRGMDDRHSELLKELEHIISKVLTERQERKDRKTSGRSQQKDIETESESSDYDSDTPLACTAHRYVLLILLGLFFTITHIVVPI
jgi:superfamily II DNA helicase RecQ